YFLVTCWYHQSPSDPDPGAASSISGSRTLLISLPSAYPATPANATAPAATPMAPIEPVATKPVIEVAANASPTVAPPANTAAPNFGDKVLAAAATIIRAF